MRKLSRISLIFFTITAMVLASAGVVLAATPQENSGSWATGTINS